MQHVHEGFYPGYILDITWYYMGNLLLCLSFRSAGKPAVSRPICPLKSLGFWMCACSVQSQLCSHAHECIANMCRLMKTDWDWLRLIETDGLMSDGSSSGIPKAFPWIFHPVTSTRLHPICRNGPRRRHGVKGCQACATLLAQWFSSLRCGDRSASLEKIQNDPKMDWNLPVAHQKPPTSSWESNRTICKCWMHTWSLTSISCGSPSIQLCCDDLWWSVMQRKQKPQNETRFADIWWIILFEAFWRSCFGCYKQRPNWPSFRLLQEKFAALASPCFAAWFCDVLPFS